MHNSLSPLRIGLAAAAGSVIAGCSLSSSSSPPSPPVTTHSAAPSSAAPSSAAPLSGPQLANILLPASSMPSGYALDPSATRNTGAQLPSDSAQPVPDSQLCQAFAQTSFIRAAGIRTGVFAQSDYVNADHSAEIAQEIDTFTGADAQQAMTRLWQAFGKCSHFSYHANGTNVSSTLTRSRLAGVGDEAIKAVVVSPVFQGGDTLVAIRMGPQIITTLVSSTSQDLGASAVRYAKQIAQRLRAAQ